jgi:hypothetical protein
VIRKFNLFILFICMFGLETSIFAQENYFLVNADNWLNLRSEPNPNSDVVKKLAKGIPVHRIDASRPETILAGNKGKWVEVEYFSSKGYLFDFYISKVKEKNALVSYQLFLTRLNSNKLESIESAKLQFLKSFPVQSNDAENGFRLFREYVLTVIDSNNGELSETLMNNYGEKSNSTVENLRKNGIDVTYCEGEAWLIEDFSYYKKILTIYKFPLKKTIDTIVNAGSSYSCDAGINISWEEMRRRISVIENFLKKEPKSPENEDLQRNLHFLISDYSLGMDNTPICDFQSNTLDNVILKSFQKFEKENTSSKYYGFFKKYFGMLKANHYKCNDKIREFAYSYFNPNLK